MRINRLISADMIKDYLNIRLSSPGCNAKVLSVVKIDASQFLLFVMFPHNGNMIELEEEINEFGELSYLPTLRVIHNKLIKLGIENNIDSK